MNGIRGFWAELGASTGDRISTLLKGLAWTTAAVVIAYVFLFDNGSASSDGERCFQEWDDVVCYDEPPPGERGIIDER